MQEDRMMFLFAAYAAVWIILAIYLYSIHAREKKMRTDIEMLKRRLKGREPGGIE